MKVKFVTLNIRRSELTVVPVTVPAWEVPVLQAIHGIGAEVTSESVRELEKLPDAQTEYDRLSNRYGRELEEDGSRGDIVAHAVYGKHMAGVMQLDAIMKLSAA